MNREDFSYDMNADPLYQQYRQQAMNLGKQAMQDTMGQATALTGGYGSSYASTAGNQAYQQYLTQLNEIVPELQSNAYDRYRQEGEALLNQYSLAADRENTDYSRYQDALNDYYTRYSMANDAWQNEKNFDYTDYQNMLSYWQQQAAAENADYWNQQDYDFQREQFDWQKAQAAKSSGSSGRSGGSSKSSGSAEPVKSASREQKIQALQYYTMEQDSTKLDAYMTTLAKQGIDTDEVWDYLQKFQSSNNR